ncbi:glycan-binding surface protein [uncultured Sphingobacterium sp.]|uniref:glycan-binding surface protein n=1 Tax=uncultured Sphingobacterium sp. TaxID=182688 RepID=UPI0025F7AFB9|nr:glycan-binding surface protein [uncultured Sphingobacterium sp.]
MKNLRIIYIFILTLICYSFFSCKKDVSSSNIQIAGVWSHSRNTESSQISSIFFNNWIRIHGNGFNGLQRVYFNGMQVPFIPIYVTDTDIIINVPETVPTGSDVNDPTLLHTIKLVTSAGQASFDGFIFRDPDKIPSITGVSYTMPYAGDLIEVYGKNLKEASAIIFPDSTKGIIKSANDSILQVIVPANIDRQKYGRVTIDIDNERYSSAPYMFFQNGVFLRTFTEEAMIAGGNNGIRIYSNPLEITALTGLPQNPEYVIAIPATKVDIPVAANNGISGNFFKFYAYKAFNTLIAKNGDIKGNTSIENLAIQFDLYMPSPWISGAIPFKMNKNRSGVNYAYLYNITPWEWKKVITGGLELNPFKFENGWKTITLKFSDFPTLAMSSLKDYSTSLQTNGFESLVGYTNYDVNEDGHTPQAVKNFQMYLANFRLVPLTNLE